LSGHRKYVIFILLYAILTQKTRGVSRNQIMFESTLSSTQPLGIELPLHITQWTEYACGFGVLGGLKPTKYRSGAMGIIGIIFS
jgi:hypothetical protein